MRLRVCVRMPEVARMERRVTLLKATSAATVTSVMSVTDVKLVSLILKLMALGLGFLGHFPCFGYPRLSSLWIGFLLSDSDCLLLI